LELHCPEKSIASFGNCIQHKSTTKFLTFDLLVYINGSLPSDIVKTAIVDSAIEITRTCNTYHWHNRVKAKITNGTNDLFKQNCMFVEVVLNFFFKNDISYRLICFKNQLINRSREIADDIFIHYVQKVVSTHCLTNEIMKIPKFLVRPDSTIYDDIICPSIEVLRRTPVSLHEGNKTSAFYIGDIQIDENDIYEGCSKNFANAWRP